MEISLSTKDKVMLFLLFLFFIILELPYLNNDGDIFWQLANGKYIASTLHMPLNNSLTFLDSRLLNKYIDHEWLSELLFYLFGLVGNIGFYILKVLLISGVYLLCYKLYSLNAKRLSFLSIILLVFMLYCTGSFSYIKPFTISLILFTCELYVLEKFRLNTSSKLVWFLPLISILWVNMHAGSFLLFPLIGVLYLLDFSFSFSIGRVYSSRLEIKSILKLLSIGIASSLLLFVNPYGLEMLLFSLKHSSDGYMKSILLEWLPPSASTQWGMTVVLVIFLLIIILLVSSKRLCLRDLLLFALFTFMSLSSQRHSLYLICLSFLLVPKYFEEVNILLKISYKKCYLFVTLCIVLVLPLTCVSIQKSSGLMNKLDICKSSILSSECSRIYTSYNYCSYLIDYDLKVFDDGRFPLYQQAIINTHVMESNSTLSQKDLNKG